MTMQAHCFCDQDASICGHRIMAITSAFQADDAGSIPAARSKFYTLKPTIYGWFFCFCFPIKILGGPKVARLLTFYRQLSAIYTNKAKPIGYPSLSALSPISFYLKCVCIY